MDDLYYVLFYHWVHDDTVFRDEQQRHYVAAGILMASYFGCRPVSMFDTTSKFEDYDSSKPADPVIPASRLKHDCSAQENIEAKKDTDSDDDRTTLVNLDGHLGHGGDAGTHYDSDSDSGTDDGIDAGLDQTRCLLWRHITFIIAPNRTPGEPNLLFAKVTIIHTKGEDHYPREYGMPSFPRTSPTQLLICF